MQTSNHNTSISGSQATIIQMAKNNATTALIQNGHILIGKLEPNNTNSSVENRSGNGANSSVQSIYPLQYIEASVANANSNQHNADVNNTTVYGTSGQKIFYQDSSHSSIYTSMSGQTATIIPASTIQARDVSSQSGASGGGASLHIQATPHAQIVHHGGNAYLVQSTARLEEESPNLSHTTKASPVTVQWLCDNYETAEGVSLPRSTLYNHYLQHCQKEKLEPMNQASFGKLIRSVFYGLRTRRLGTRGNSKYHYYGIRIKPNSTLNHYVEEETFAMRQYPSFHRQSQDNDISWRNRCGNNNGGYGGNGLDCDGSATTNGGSLTNNNAYSANSECNPVNQHSCYLGESSSALPNVSDIMTRVGLDTLAEDDCLVEGVTLADISLFCHMYLDHSDTVLSAVVYLNFKFIESLWQDFWRTSTKTNHSQALKLEEKLSTAQLQSILKLPQVQSFLQLFDNVFYQSLVEVLIPNVLRPIPSALTQNIRHFAKSLEGWMSTATVGLHPTVVQIKMSCVCSLAQTLRRHTSLNHLAQAARAVLKNANQISQMLMDLNRVDFSNVQEQASWVCGCDSKRVDALQQDFKRILQQQASLEEWAAWLDNVVNEVLEPFKESQRYSNAAHQFMLKWSFYSSMVIRDLTLRSAASFGSFHLIRLLYDEYIYYLVEQKVAAHLNQTPVAVTGEMGRQLMAGDCGNYGYGQLQAEMDNKSKFKIDQLGMKGDSFGNVSSTSRPSSVDPDLRLSSAVNNFFDSNQSVSSYNNSNPTVDEQVDESADDDEGLDEEELQINEQLSTTRASVVLKTESSSVCRPPPTIANNSARKTVNVTTFGEPRQATNDNAVVTATKINAILNTATNLKASSPIVKSSLSANESGTKRIKLVNSCIQATTNVVSVPSSSS